MVVRMVGWIDKMVKLRWLKEWKIRKVGDVSNVAEKGAVEFVKNGYAEYVEEPKKEIIKKEKIIKQIPKKDIPNYLKAEEEVKELYGKTLGEQYTKIAEICRRYEVSQSYCQDVLKIKKDLEEDKIKLQKKLELEKEESIKKQNESKPSQEYTEQELKDKGLIDYTETDEEHRKRTASMWAEKFTREKLRKEGLLKFVENPLYGLTLKTKVLSDINLKLENRATERIVKEIERLFNIYTTLDDAKSEMWIYDDGIYIPNAKSKIEQFCRAILQENYKDKFVNNVIDKIRADTFIEQQKLFSVNYPNEIPVQNGILNIETGELTPFNPEKIFFNKLPVKFDTTKNCPKIEQFLKDVLANEEDIKVFYEIAGFALLKEYKYEKAFMFIGNGRNGKSKSIELLKRLIGAENCMSLSLSALTVDNADLSQLFGKMLNLAGDIGNQDLKDTAMFKALTGRDLITAHRKYLQAIVFENYAKFVFACNELPMVYDMTKAFWERWVLLDFPYTFVTKEDYDKEIDKTYFKIKDDDIIHKISTDDELSGLLNEALIALNRLKGNKKFSHTQGSAEVKSSWIRRSNSFMAFCYDFLDGSSDTEISKKELRIKYAEYCKLHSIQTKSDYALKRALQEMFGVTEERRNTIGNNWDSYWVGIKWKS